MSFDEFFLLDQHAYWDRERQEGPTDLGPGRYDEPQAPESDEAYEARVRLNPKLGHPHYRQRRERAKARWEADQVIARRLVEERSPAWLAALRRIKAEERRERPDQRRQR